MEQLTNLIISDHELALISNVLFKLMNDTSASSVMLLDKSGQVVTTQGSSTKRNATSLGALLAGAVLGSAADRDEASLARRLLPLLRPGMLLLAGKRAPGP